VAEIASMRTVGRGDAASWADDLNGYRGARGSRAFSTVNDMAAPVERFPRTKMVPFGATGHPYYAYGDVCIPRGSTVPKPMPAPFATDGSGVRKARACL
jgi:hypothetical protein